MHQVAVRWQSFRLNRAWRARTTAGLFSLMSSLFISSLCVQYTKVQAETLNSVKRRRHN